MIASGRPQGESTGVIWPKPTYFETILKLLKQIQIGAKATELACIFLCSIHMRTYLLVLITHYLSLLTVFMKC